MSTKPRKPEWPSAYSYRNLTEVETAVYVVVNFISAWDEASSCSEQYIFWIKYIL